MPADTDHIRRDALHAARSEVRILVSKWIRRLDADAKAKIESAIAEGGVSEDGGTELGREAALAAIAEAVDANKTAVQHAAASELGAGEDS